MECEGASPAAHSAATAWPGGRRPARSRAPPPARRAGEDPVGPAGPLDRDDPVRGGAPEARQEIGERPEREGAGLERRAAQHARGLRADRGGRRGQGAGRRGPELHAKAAGHLRPGRGGRHEPDARVGVPQPDDELLGLGAGQATPQHHHPGREGGEGLPARLGVPRNGHVETLVDEGLLERFAGVGVPVDDEDACQARGLYVEPRCGTTSWPGRASPSSRSWPAARLLVAFDYDGVLAPLVTAPDGRAMRPATARLLREVARRYPVAIVSGRAWRDLARLVPGPGLLRVGNHGFELGRPVAVPGRWWPRSPGGRRRSLAGSTGSPGWHVEHKQSTLSIHYGMGRDWRRVERKVRAAGRALRGARLLPGKKVLNVIPSAFPTKGDAVRRLLSRFRLDVALFLGDDRTDEDVFRIGEPEVVGVRVGAGRTAARWRLGSQEEVDVVLERFRVCAR